MGLLKWLARILGAPPEPSPSARPSSTQEGRNYEASTSASNPNTAAPIASGLAGLDTDRFQPLTTDEAMAETQTANWQTAYWDPLNTIPPADLARIRVIDGTMVGMGLITEKELVEIHEIGQEMDRYKNREAHLRSAGTAEVARSRREKDRRKAQKKEEAAARKVARAQAIVDRKENDIVFLGRGVSKGLSDRRANIEKLTANDLPVLSAPAELAAALNLSVSQLRWLSYHSEAPTRVHYIAFEVAKKSGGVRRLAAPHAHLAVCQNWILENILNRLPVHDAAHGFVGGRSTVTNATPHKNTAVVVNSDLSDFFPSIHFYRVEGLFRSFGYSPAVATILALLCTESPRDEVIFQGERFYPAVGPRALPQGACTSPALSNLISRNLDVRLQGIANKLGWNYTRYADDLTFSAPEDAGAHVGYLLARIRHICQDEGFQVNEKKTRVLRRNTRQSVTGIVVNDRLSIPRSQIRRVRAILHQAQKTGLDAQNRENHPHFREWVTGMIAYINMVNPEQGKKLSDALSRL